MNFADKLKLLRDNAAEQRLREQEETKLRLTKRYNEFFEKTVMSDCLEASARGESTLGGFLCTRWYGGSWRLSLYEFDGLFENSICVENGVSYIIERFGKEYGYVESLCKEFREILSRLGLSGFSVEPVLREFCQQNKTVRPFSKKVSYSVSDVWEEYVIYVKLGW